MADRFELIENTCVSDADSPPAECAQVLRREDCALALAEIQTWPGYQSTPLRSLPGLARAAGIGELLYKDESGRFGLGSFKALGGAYAVYRYLVRELAEHGISMPVSVPELMAGKHAEIVSTYSGARWPGTHRRSAARLAPRRIFRMHRARCDLGQQGLYPQVRRAREMWRYSGRRAEFGGFLRRQRTDRAVLCFSKNLAVLVGI